MVSDLDIIDAEVLWNYHCIKDFVESASNTVIIGLGSYDTRVAEHCASLYLSGQNNKIIFSGNRGNWTNELYDDNVTEAKLFADIAIKLGVESSSIILEDKSTNIGENIKFSIGNNLDIISNVDNIIVVTKPNTLRRAYATFNAIYPELSHKLLLSAPNYNLINHSPLLSLDSIISELGGDIERIIFYPDMGFQVPQDVPLNVIKSYIRLKHRGYVEHCLKKL